MSFRDCVESAVKAGRLSREQAEDLYARQRDAADRFVLDQQHSPESAARLGQELSIERAKQNIRLRKYQAALQAIKLSQNTDRVLGYRDGPNAAIGTLLDADKKALADWENVVSLETSILGQAHARMAEGLSALRTRWLGFYRDAKTLRNVVYELAGEPTGDATAAGMAKAFAESAETMRLRFNRAGGAIPRLVDWIMPQVHDAVRVGRVSAQEWTRDVMGWLNIDRMTDFSTGSAFTPDALRLTLQGVYETIRTNGVSDLVPGAQGGGKKLANRHQEHRFLIFKDAESWLAYQQKYGSQNIFGTMMDHLRGMSREIALLETFGPNAAAGFRALQDVALKREDKPISRAFNQAKFRALNGTGDPNRSPMLAQVLGAVRAWNVAKYLGAAALSAVTDTATMVSSSLWNGLPVTGVLRRYISQLNPLNEADRIFATRIGITALSFSNAYSNVGRFVQLEGVGGGTASKIAGAGQKFAEATLRASGLNAMTDAGKRAFAMEFSANLAENFGRPLADIDGNFGRTLREHGMTAEEWDVLRTTPTTDHQGAKFFTIDQLIDREDLPLSQRQKLAYRVQSIINEEMQMAVVEPTVGSQVISSFGGARGSGVGEVGRTVMQFKSFPLAMVSLHLQRAWYARQLRGGGGAASYAATAIIGTTVMGMVAMQMKLISKGKNPRDMEDPKAWAAAFVQGGGAGIFGDFLFADANRFGGGLAETLAGPTVSEINELRKLTLGNVQQALSGEDPNVLADVVGYLSRYTPGGNLWYTRLLLEREVFDQLAIEADPSGARKRFRRAERRAREQGTDYWWRPGRTAPDRAPEIGDQ